MTPSSPETRYSPEWLSLREGADAAARAVELVDPLRAAAAGRGPLVIRDLGCGTGSMGRWLAPRLPGPQHWILHDRDPDLLTLAAAGMPPAAADGAAVTVATRHGDLTALTAADLTGTWLVTGSALLDLLTAAQVDRLGAACAAAGCAALFTLSVTGRVDIHPADPLDAAIGAAFNDHQRRGAGERRLLGPDAVEVAADAFARHGAAVRTGPSPWRLGADRAGLAATWLRAWVAIAVEQRPDLASPAAAYLRRRLDVAAGGGLRIVIHHTDLLARPR